MGQGVATRAEGTPDLVITGAVVLDHWGVIKADIGIRDGRIVALGKAGNPDTMDGVHPDLVIGPSTEVIAGNGLIVTAGGIDSHVHLIAPQQIPVAIAAGMTTLIGGGTGPAEGTKATTVTPGAFWLDAMMHALTAWPVNVVLLGKGNTVSAEGLWEQLRAGAAGFKLHEDWGTTPAAIDACLTVGAGRRGAGRDPHRHAERGRLPRVDARGDRRPADPHVSHRGGRRRARTRHHPGRLVRRTCCRRRPTRPGRTPATRWTSTSTC